MLIQFWLTKACILTIVTVPYGLHELRDYLLEYKDLAAVATKSEIPILEPTQQEASPTPVKRHRVVFFQVSNIYSPTFTKLVKAAAAEGIEITMVSEREAPCFLQLPGQKYHISSSGRCH